MIATDLSGLTSHFHTTTLNINDSSTYSKIKLTHCIIASFLLPSFYPPLIKQITNYNWKNKKVLIILILIAIDKCSKLLSNV